MKKDKEDKGLAHFITAHRAEFDDQELPDKVWQGVLAGLEKQSNDSHSATANADAASPETQNANTRNHRLLGQQWFKIAATLFIASLFGITIYFYGKQQGYADYARINPELAASRADYQQLVQQRKDSVMAFVRNDLGLETEFEDALTYMEANYETLKKELASSPNQERTLRAMILNLQAQAEVLNQQLLILSKLNYTQNEKL